MESGQPLLPRVALLTGQVVQLGAEGETMESVDRISVHDESAATYDRQVRDYNSYGHDVLFGMCYEYVAPGERLLDIGIGTGLASRTFADAGLEVFGCDGSSEMLKVCGSKGFASELRMHDLEILPLPYSDGFFDHVICCGVFHFFGSLEGMFGEVSRITRPGGIFAFTVAALTPGEEAAGDDDWPGYSESPTPWGIPIFRHGSGYLTDQLGALGIEILKTQKLLIRGGPAEDDPDMPFSVYIARKVNADRA